ncbi:MAG: hypothetical protein AB8G99_04880 [Planctomycetaceae bacterium]
MPEIVVCICIVAGVTLFAMIAHHLQQVTRAEEFPPISDEEYLRRCGPEIPSEVALGVRQVLSDALGVDEATIYPEHRLIEDLGAE